MPMLSDAEIESAFSEINKRVQVSCDEYHPHTAVDGCLNGNDPKDVLICKLIETIKTERKIFREAVAKIPK